MIASKQKMVDCCSPTSMAHRCGCSLADWPSYVIGACAGESESSVSVGHDMKEGLLVNGLPVWVRIISTVGIPAAIAFFLLGMLSGMIPSPLSTVYKSFVELASAVNAHSVDSSRSATEFTVILRSYTENHLRLLRQICRNQAKDEWSLRDCDR